MDTLRIAAIPVGYALEYYGRRKDMWPIEWLGHYLTCRGTPKTLNDRQMELIVRQYKISSYQVTRNDNWMTLDEGVTAYPNENVVGGSIFRKDDLFHALGKVRVKKARGMFNVLDYYIFYSTCYQVERHGRGCECRLQEDYHVNEAMNWGPNIFLKVEYPQRIAERWQDIWIKVRRKHYGYFAAHTLKGRIKERLIGWLYKVVDEKEIRFAELMIRIGHSSLSVQGRDRFFTRFGKPFYTTGHIRMEDEEALAA